MSYTQDRIKVLRGSMTKYFVSSLTVNDALSNHLSNIKNYV